MKPAIMEVDEETDFEYMLHEWLPDMALMYRKAGFPEKSIAFCEKIIELFSWEDGAPNEFKKCIGEALKEAGRTDESDRWFEGWLSEEPDNYECVEACIFHWMGRGENQRVRELLERYLPENTECSYENQMLFMRAAVFYEMVGEKENAERYRRESTEFTKQFLGEDILF